MGLFSVKDLKQKLRSQYQYEGWYPLIAVQLLNFTALYLFLILRFIALKNNSPKICGLWWSNMHCYTKFLTSVGIYHGFSCKYNQYIQKIKEKAVKCNFPFLQFFYLALQVFSWCLLDWEEVVTSPEQLPMKYRTLWVIDWRKYSRREIHLTCPLTWQENPLLFILTPLG